jgi:uncharacterized protein YdhG (YjbR/CyaY superfamily)
MSTQSSTAKAPGFSADEKAAMRERAREAKAEAKRGADREAGLQDLLAKIADLPQPDKGIAERLHAVVTATAPQLDPKTYYGMPAYARNGKIVCFLKPASKFGDRYATLGFEEQAQLDAGEFWPVAYALTEWTTAVEKQITSLVKKAAPR